MRSIKDSTFLVTGGAGFIGSNIVNYLLKQGAGKVKILDNLSTGFFSNISEFVAHRRVEFREGDIRDVEVCRMACQGVDYVSHQAALGSVTRSVLDPVTTNSVNVDGFLNILFAAKEARVRRFVYASSSSVYGDDLGLPKIEERTGSPLSPYAVTKKVNELYANTFSQAYGIETIGLRYFNVFGPGQSPNGEYAAVIPRFIKAVYEEYSPEIFGDGEQGRDFTYIDNVVQANIKSMFTTEQAALNRVFNVACGERNTINNLFLLLKEIAGSSLSVKYAGVRNGDIRDSLADISAAKQLLNFDPEIDIRTGLRLTYDWYVKQQSLK